MAEFLPEMLVKLRREGGLTQKELGMRLGISDRAVSKWEMGLSRPSGEHLLSLSEVLGAPVEAFFARAAVSEENREQASGMASLRELYRIGRGPSSSHTIGPERVCREILARYGEADRFEVTLYGSLAKTGRGHGTDGVIRKTLAPLPVAIRFDGERVALPHPNTMRVRAYRGEVLLGEALAMSVGGGSIRFLGEEAQGEVPVYSLASFREIAALCTEKGWRLPDYVLATEGEDFSLYMREIWEAMKRAVSRGLADEGVLPGGLGVQKKAKSLIESAHPDESAETKENRTVCAYAFAVGEQNASGETVVTAPTCGAAGVLPAVLYYQQKKHGRTDEEMIRALMTAGVIGNLIKTNASISGAECGCQAEVGSACAMAAAALSELYGFSLDRIEYAAEVAIEHHLGLTCDPICGLVQIPCIERNAVAAMRAVSAAGLATFLAESRKISFDRVVNAMKETGRDMHRAYKETSEGGLARLKI